MKTVVGLFENLDQAQSSFGDFARLGLSAERIGLLCRTSPGVSARGLSTVDLPDVGTVAANRPMLDLLDEPSLRRNREGMLAALMKMGVSKVQAERCVDVIKRGGALEALIIADDKEGEALAIMKRRSGDRKYQAEELPREVVIPLIQEELSVDKREIDAGGVRISTHITSRPIDKTVTLYEEHVKVERRIVDRPIDVADEAFADRSIAMKASAEEPLVEKRCHVVEEIVIHKDRSEHVETIRDTLRHTEVDVSELPAERGLASYKKHFGEAYSSSGAEFESYAPAYAFGEKLRGQAEGEEWSKIEPRAKAMWAERSGAGPFERFKEAIKFAWEKAKLKARS
jgi:uncharacterized protein (TIGR02271 family)